MSTNQQILPPKPAVDPKLKNIFTMLEAGKAQIAQAVPKHLTAERMLRVVRTAISKTPKLQECTPVSILGAVIEASQLGLETDGILGQGYLVPFWNSKTRSMEAQFQPGYRGLISLARRSGQVSSIGSEIVYMVDKFKVVYGVHRDLIHEPSLDDPSREESGIRGCYATVLYKDLTFDFEYMSLHELNRVRDMSKAKDKEGNEYGPWATHTLEMFRKVPIRRLAKRLPLSPEFQKAAMLDEYVDAGVAPSAELAVDSFSEAARLATEQTAQRLLEKHSELKVETPENPMHPPLETVDQSADLNPSSPSLTTPVTEQQTFNPFAKEAAEDGQPNLISKSTAPSESESGRRRR